MNKQDIFERNNIQIIGKGAQALLMAHGFGCDQKMWRFVAPMLEHDYRLVLFDYVGSGGSRINAYDANRYASLEGYAEDIIEICEALDLHNISIVGHSVSGIISLIAAHAIPQRIKSLIMVCPSPYFMNEPPDYAGGFEKADLEDLITLMDSNFIGWANYLSPLVMGHNNPEELVAELSDSFCSTDPVIAKNFARATFFSDYRWLLPKNTHPTLLIQSRWDSLASLDVTQYMQAQMPQTTTTILEAEGHCPHMSHPAMVADAIRDFLQQNDPL
ncbi:alpha/beta hydrolase fold protein [Methylophaga lonarensis MPL]|uniref:Alpha/beta hydrolase fold protein n=1 Tax=Methylophaga lonarensis MPL TaxID=1286106 RepID=M7PJA8_9GAMM|nr:alpha/beta hydrolase [Methylophaga lonarensis]EMR13975.1 alpha/beta hydrolase fold protein [Methylophaga lonarensis MPL]